MIYENCMLRVLHSCQHSYRMKIILSWWLSLSKPLLSSMSDLSFEGMVYTEADELRVDITKCVIMVVQTLDRYPCSKGEERGRKEKGKDFSS